MHLDPYKDEHRSYQHTEIFKLIYNTGFYIKGLNTNNRVQTHSGSFKTEFEIQYDIHDDVKR